MDPFVQVPMITNPQNITPQPQNTATSITNVNGNQQEQPYSIETIVPPATLATHGNHGEAMAGISNIPTGDYGERAYSFAPGVLTSPDIYTPAPQATPVPACTFPQPYMPPTASILHLGSGLGNIPQPSTLPTSDPVTKPLMPVEPYSSNDASTNTLLSSLPPIPASSALQVDKHVDGPASDVEKIDQEHAEESRENVADLDRASTNEELCNKSEQKPSKVVIEDAEKILHTHSNLSPLEEQDSIVIAHGAPIPKQNIPVENTASALTAESDKIEAHSKDSSNTLEDSNAETLKSSVAVDFEPPKEDCDKRNPLEECDKGGVSVFIKKTLTIVESASSNEECEVSSLAKHCNRELIPDTPPNHQGQNDVSCLLQNAVLVQAPLLETVEPVEDVKPVVGGCLDDIGRVEESPEKLTIVPAGLMVDETDDGIAVTKINPIVPMVTIFDTDIINQNEERFLGADGYGSEEEPFDPDMNECGEMIGISTDDEIELKRSIVAQKVSRAKHCKKESMESHSTGEASEAKAVLTTAIKAENGINYESDEKSSIPLHKRSEPCKKKRKIHSIRIVDVKKELLHIDEQNSGDSPDNYISKTSKTKKRKQASSSSDVPFGSGFDSSCEEILDDDCLNDELQTQSKRSRCSNNDASRVNPRKAKKVEIIAGLKLPSDKQQQLQKLVLKQKPKTRDRFYDRSQDIPNDIYFENMNVPLHILHGTSSSSSDEQLSDVSKYSNTNNSSRRKRASSSTSRGETNYISLQSMKMFLKIAGFRHVRYQKLWKDCHTNQDRAEAILRFLQDSGLQGEPTFEKCRELRKQIQLENEAKVLDVNAIISAGEGRVTRQRTKMLATASTPQRNEKKKSDEIGKHATPQEGTSQSEGGQTQGNAEASVDVEKQQTMVQQISQPKDEPTQCHNKQDTKTDEQQTVQHNELHAEDEPSKSNIEQASTVPQETKATNETLETDTGDNNLVVPAEQ